LKLKRLDAGGCVAELLARFGTAGGGGRLLKKLDMNGIDGGPGAEGLLNIDTAPAAIVLLKRLGPGFCVCVCPKSE
jgi:hypothetical protein